MSATRVVASIARLLVLRSNLESHSFCKPRYRWRVVFAQSFLPIIHVTIEGLLLTLCNTQCYHSTSGGALRRERQRIGTSPWMTCPSYILPCSVDPCVSLTENLACPCNVYFEHLSVVECAGYLGLVVCTTVWYIEKMELLFFSAAFRHSRGPFGPRVCRLRE